MPIINLCKATDEGAIGHHYQAGYWKFDADARTSGEAPGPSAYWTRLTNVGLCLRDYERNGYDDSDFHMIVWNPSTEAPEDICFASTRGWSYPCYGSSVDATPEVKAAYQAYLRRQEAAKRQRTRDGKAAKLRAQRAEMRRGATAFGFPYIRLLRLRAVMPAENFARLTWLLSAKVRSNFKLSMRKNLVEWLRNDQPKYPTPLSKRQIECLQPNGA